jgi:hypothetical protein
MWMYGIAGLVGFLGQIIPGIAGRLLPMYAWYRAFEHKGGPPDRAAHDLPDPRFARPIFVAWTLGVPALAWGLAGASEALITAGAALLLAAVVLGGAYLAFMLREARAVKA